jgi:hypothetical protein
MKTIARQDSEVAEDLDAEFKPLTADEARELRAKNPSVSPWRVIAGQLVVGLVVALAAWGLTGRQNLGWSAAYGGFRTRADRSVFFLESGHCGVRILPVGNGQDGLVRGDADRRAKADNGAELASNADRPGGDNEGGLVGGDVLAPAPATERRVTEWLLKTLRNMVRPRVNTSFTT